MIEPLELKLYNIKDLIYDSRKNVFARIVMVVENVYVRIVKELARQIAQSALSKFKF